MVILIITVFGKLYQGKHGEVGMMHIVLTLLGMVRFMLSVKLKHKDKHEHKHKHESFSLF